MNADCIVNIQPADPPIHVVCPNGEIMQSTHTAELSFTKLPPAARKCHVFPSLASGSLISVGVLCDAGCIATFGKNFVNITLNGETVLSGVRTDRLWHISDKTIIPTQPFDRPVANATIPNSTHYANVLAPTNALTDRVDFYRASLGNPTLSTLCTALDKARLVSFPGHITAKQVRKVARFSESMHQGHLTQESQGIQSTQNAFYNPPQENSPALQDLLQQCTSPTSSENKSHYIFAACIQATGTIHSDPTGRFIHPSAAGNNYCLVVYCYDSNSIHVEAIPSRLAEVQRTVYATIYKRLRGAGLSPKLNKLDNETSDILQQFMNEENVTLQLVPPYLHRRNAAERAIRTFKDHFIAILCGTDPEFPLKLWDKLLPQAIITLNLLRSSRVNPRLSAYAQVWGAFDYNRTPLAPPGTKLLLHLKPSVRESWAPHAVRGWYLGPAMDHYRCYRVWNVETCAERIVDTVVWFPSKVKMPVTSPQAEIVAAAQDLVKVLLMPSTSSLISTLDDNTRISLVQLATIFQNSVLEDPAISPTDDVEDWDDSRPFPRLEILEDRDDSSPLPRVEMEASTPTLPVVDEPASPVITYADKTRDPGQRRRRKKRQQLLSQRESTLRVPLSRTSFLLQDETTMDEIVDCQDQNNDTGNIVDSAVPSQLPTSTPTDLPASSPTSIPTLSPITDPLLAQKPPSPPAPKIRRIPPTARQTRAKLRAVPQPTRKSRRGLIPNRNFANSSVSVTPTELHTIQVKIAQLQIQKQELDDYQSMLAATKSMVKRQENRPAHAFWTANSVVDKVTGEALEYSALKLGTDSKKWIQGCSNEMGRLVSGVLPHMKSGSQTIHFIHPSEKPSDRRATYLRIVAELKPHKVETHRVRFTVGGDRIDYKGTVTTPTAELQTVKLHLNSVISTTRAKYMTMDIKNFYLNSPMDRYEYMRIPVSHIPADIMEQYQLAPLIVNGYVMVEIRKGMYGLPQAGILAHNRLTKHLSSHGYVKCPNSPGLFKHISRDISFTLVVDDFGVKYTNKNDVIHLISTLKKVYEITTDWTGSVYLGLHLRWDYIGRTVDLSMPGYVKKALQRFCSPHPRRPQHSPYAWSKPTYGSKIQLSPVLDTSPSLDSSGKTRLQEIVGTLLYHARAVNNPLLPALSTIGADQSVGTEATASATTQLLDYCATYPDPVLRFKASKMVLRIHSDASYLSVRGARSRAAGFFYLSDPSPAPDFNHTDTATDLPPINGAVHVLCTILKNVVASATEAEVGAVFVNCQDAVSIRHTLEDLGHPQPATPVQVDNQCACGILNDTVKQRRSKAMDMRFYWVKDRVRQGQFIIYWRPGKDNLADYHTKHHAPAHHRQVRSTYLLNCLRSNGNRKRNWRPYSIF